MAKVKAIIAFKDLVENTMRKVGEEWECTDARAHALTSGQNPSRLKLAELIAEEKEEKAEKKEKKDAKKSK